MPDGLYMSFNQGFSSTREYSKDMICPSVSYSFWSDSPTTSLKVGQSLLWSNLLSTDIENNYVSPTDSAETDSAESNRDKCVLVITKISITDEVIGERNGYPFRQWQFTLDGYLTNKRDPREQDPTPEVIISRYSVNVEALENGDTIYKISLETINYGDTPVTLCSIGDTESSSTAFEDIPGVPVSFTCTNYSYSDSYNDLNMHVWTVLYEGNAIVPHEGEPDDNADISISYELNGSTARTVDGDIVALRRSEAPIMKKTITKYTDSSSRLTTPGSTYQGGIVLSESVIQETIKNNNVIVHSYYKHTIEVEGSDRGSEGEQTEP